MNQLISYLIIILFPTIFIDFVKSDDIPENNSYLNIDLFFEPIISKNLLNIKGLEKENNDGLIDVLRITRNISVSFEEVTFKQVNNNDLTIHLMDSIPFNQPDFPLVPMRTDLFSFPKNVVITDVVLENVTIQKCTKSVIFQTTPKPLFWSVNTTSLHIHVKDIIKERKESYCKSSLYPGKSHSYLVGKNNTNTTVNVYLFPIQYDNFTNEMFLISNGVLTIYYQINKEFLINTSNEEEYVENIIITPPQFFSQANKLKRFHNDLGTPTNVVTTTWISTRFRPIDYPPVNGYKDFSLLEKIPKYKDKLARKIISYLQSLEQNPNLKFVTIFGNGRHVPPSYYFGYSYYPVPTDFYYSSPDLDLIPNYCVGRLPVNNIIEASKVVQKIINWNPTNNQMDKVAIAGGIPFETPFYIGELITIDSVNQGFFNGLSIEKYYRSEERFDEDDILTALNKDYGLFYMISHGSPFLIAVEEGLISVKDILKMDINTNAPILSCIACSCGSFDTYLIKQGIRLDKTSFGESVMLSKGGAIAYIGGSRTNDGYPLFTLSHGRVLITKETYMAGLLTYVNQGYLENLGYLGELTKFAADTYLLKNDMDDFWNQYHYFSFVLLGDPALKLPKRMFNKAYHPQPISEAVEPVGYMQYDSAYEEYNGTVVLNAIDEKSGYRIISESSIIDIKNIDTGNYQMINKNKTEYATINGSVYYQITPIAGEMMLLRFESDDGKEDWIYYQPVRPVNDEYDILTKGFNKTRWNHISDAIANSDPYDLIYVFNGIYNESISISKPIDISGEQPRFTVIDGRSHGNIVAIYSYGVSISGFTIEHCGNNLENAAIMIKPGKTWKPEPIIIEDNHIMNNLNFGLYINSPNILTNSLIQISSNKILYNNYGIYIQSSLRDKVITENFVYGNNFGLYFIESQNDVIQMNTFENNKVGLYLNNVKDMDLTGNYFIDNKQQCQFGETKNTIFDSNYWDNWIGHLFKRYVPLPKIINGIHDSERILLSQIKIDRHPLSDAVEKI